MGEWSESWRVILLITCCCLLFSSVLGVGLAVMLKNSAWQMPQWEWQLPAFAFPTPWQQTQSGLSSEPPTVPPTVAEVPLPTLLALLGYQAAPVPEVISLAKEYLGVPYLYAGELERDGMMDCSAFTVLIYGKLGIPLPRTTYGQVLLGEEVTRIEDMLPGDLIFFQDTWPNNFQLGVTHVAIYMGNYHMIHCSLRMGGVAITSINDVFYMEHWHSVRRILPKEGRGNLS